MTPQDHIASAAYYRDRAKVRLGEQKAGALRMAAYHDAMAVRERFHDLRRSNASQGPWMACACGWDAEMEELREEYREAIWDFNWAGFYVERPSAARQEAA